MKYTVKLTLHVNEEEIRSLSPVWDMVKETGLVWESVKETVWEAVKEIPTWDDQSVIVNVEMEDPKLEEA